MCNNLLQFAHVYAWGREHHRMVLSMRFSYKYPYFAIRHTRHCSFALYLLAKAAAAVRLLPTASFKHDDCDRQALERMMLRHRNIVVAGWYVRYYDLVVKYLDELRALFLIDPDITAPVSQALAGLPDGALRLGVHIRRGDYKQWKGGRYYYADNVYTAHIQRFAELNPGREIHVFLSTNDPAVSAGDYARAVPCPNVHIHRMAAGNAPQDLFLLSECDYIIGPPSTFSVVATMYGRARFYRIDTPDPEAMRTEDFRDFNHAFRVLE